MSTFALKIIAIIAMLIDHVGAIFVPSNSELYFIMRSIGRLAFPIFVFLIVEGFFHTRNNKKYLMRLGIFALISEIPFDLAFYNYLYHSYLNADINYIAHLFINKQSFSQEFKLLLSRLMSHQNVFFTLFLGLLLITLMNKIENKLQKYFILSNLVNTLLTVMFCAAAYFLKSDYDYVGILLIVAFYLFRSSKLLITITLLIFSATLLYGPSMNKFSISLTLATTCAMIPIFFYNGEKGKNVKYLFYIFYPAHLLILYLINTMI